MKNGDFHGLPTYVLENEHLTLEVLREAGPRVVRLSPAASKSNLFAELPHTRLPSPYGPYSLYGGHRLWHAPELPARTYVPDDDGVTVHVTPRGARLHRPADPYSHIARTVEVELHDSGPTVTVNHILRNAGHWPVELAAWAITQLPTGGVAILPQRTTALDAAGLLPNRQLTLWPYARWSDPRLELGDDLILVHGRAERPEHFKIGYLNHDTWAAYLAQGYLFVKVTNPQPQQAHADMGCNTEVYTDDGFLELETLSPLSRLEPGAELAHRETWVVYPAPGVAPSDGEAIRQLVKNLPDR